MFRFVYALAGDERRPEAAAMSAFEGVECPVSKVDAAAVGRRIVFAELDRVVDPPAYLSIALTQISITPPALGERLRQAAEQWQSTLILVENGGAFSTATELWDLMEAANHPRVKIAWDAEIDSAISPIAARSPAVVIPTLNLRIGAVRLHAFDTQAHAYVKRLAGIGFEGWIFIDPPVFADRSGAATQIVAQICDFLQPPKPIKKTATPTR